MSSTWYLVSAVEFKIMRKEEKGSQLLDSIKIKISLKIRVSKDDVNQNLNYTRIWESPNEDGMDRTHRNQLRKMNSISHIFSII